MFIRSFITAILFTLATATHAQLYPALTGPELLDKLITDYKPATVLDYGPARDLMYSEIYNVNDSVSCVYSGYRHYLPDGVDPSAWLAMNNSANGINCEHTWPQSKGADSGNPKSDMHHLFPTRAGVNTVRDNFPYGEIPDAVTTKWYRLDQELTAIPTDHLDEYSERINGTFEPREDHKGNVARAMFYFYTMYRPAAAADPQFFATQRQTLCQWDQFDPADSLEIARTWLIAAQQSGKPNPYVLDCSLADRTFCSDTPSNCESTYTAAAERPSPPVTATLAFFPNPTTGDIRIDAPFASAHLTITDLAGRTVLTRTWSAGETVAKDALPTGTYFVFLTSGKERMAGRLVKN